MLEFNIRNQEISRIDNFSPAEKSVEYLIAKFNFKTEDWSEATKRAIFRNVKSKVEKDTMLEDDFCIVPWEVLVGSSDIEVSVHGVIGTEEITTNVVVFNLSRTLQGGSATQEPSPTVYEQMAEMVKETKEIAQSVRTDADNGKFNGSQGPVGKDGKSAYEIAVAHGFEGSEEEWLASLQGENDGKDNSDATVTTDSITKALGYKPANAETVSALQNEIADLAILENGVIKFYKTATEEGEADTELFDVDLSSIGGSGGLDLNNLTLSVSQVGEYQRLTMSDGSTTKTVDIPITAISDEQVQTAVNDYLTANPISGLTWGDVEDGESFGVTGTEDEPTEEENPSTTTEYVKDNLAVYYDFTQYEDNYTGEVEDLSGNNVVPDITNLEYSYSGRGGFLGNKLMLGATDLISGTNTEVKLGFSTDAIKTYPFTIELYAHLRKRYNNTLPDGELGYMNTSLPGFWNMNVFSNRYSSIDASSPSLNGIDGRTTENTVGVYGSANRPNIANCQATVDLTIDGFNNANIGEEYHHLVFCVDSNEQKVYLDGLLVLDKTESSIQMTSNGYLRMFDLDLKADLKMIRVYSDILTEYEVYTNYQSVVGGTNNIEVLSETETDNTVTRKSIKELDKFPVTMARAVYMNNSSTTVEDEIKSIKNGGVKGGSIVLNAIVDETGKVSFKNSDNVTVFTLDLSQMNVGALQLPRIYLNGDTTNMGEDSPVPMKFKYVDKEKKVEAYTETEWQGNTSIAFPIKNYAFDLYSDETLTESLDVQFLPHMATDSYHLKANYIDPSNVKNLAGARLFDYVCKSIGLTLPNDSRCVVDGIPVEVYINNKFNGVYTLNYKQSKSLFGMGDGEAEFIYRCEDGTGWGLFSGDSFPTKEEFDLIWEARYPKPAKLTHHDEIQRMLKWVNDATDDEFKTNYASYLNMDSVLAYFICGDIMAWLDNSAKNLTVCSWDGLVWYTIPYDMDMGMCDVTASGMINAGGNLWSKVSTNFADEKKAMYKTLRDNGMNVDTIFALYSDILYSIGLNGYIADKKIKYIPYDNLDSRISFEEFDDYITYHKEFIKQRIELMDTTFGYTSE